MQEPGQPGGADHEQRAERVADEAVDALARFVRTGAAIDAYLVDQLLLPLACVAGRSTLYTEAVTPHLLTNAQVIQTFVPAAIRIDGRVGEPGQVVIDGVGL